MKHFPIFLAVTDKRIVLAGGGDAAMAKLRLLMKTEANIHVFAPTASPEIKKWAHEGKLTLTLRALQNGDADDAVLFYGATEDSHEDARGAAIAKSAGALVNIVDNLADSAFITPAIVDRDPVTIAIGTEGAAPVLARAIKADLEAKLPASLGTLAKIGKTFRHAVDVLPFGSKRRNFWSDFYFKAGPTALDAHGQRGVIPALETLLDDHITAKPAIGHVDFVGAGPGDPELLTLKARKSVDRADVIIHDRDIAPAILELARREAVIIDAETTDAAALIKSHAAQGHHIVRLSRGDTCDTVALVATIAAGVSHSLIAGIPLASAEIIPFQQRNTAVHARCTSGARAVTSNFYPSEAI